MEEGQDVERYREQQRKHARFTPDPDHVKVDGVRYEVVGDDERVDPDVRAA
jgi:hypothetical protein